MKVIEAINAALAKATMPKEVKASLDNVLDSHKIDLGDVGYEPSTDTEDAIKELNSVLDEIDSGRETQTADLKESAKLAREDESTEL